MELIEIKKNIKENENKNLNININKNENNLDNEITPTPEGKDMIIYESDLNDFLKNTIEKCYDENDLEFINNNEGLISYFKYIETVCLNYINETYLNKQKRKLYKEFLSDSLLEIFTKSNKNWKIGVNIVKKLKNLNIKFLTSNEFLLTLENYVNSIKEICSTNNIPKFLFSKSKKKIKNIIKIRDYEENLSSMTQTNIEVKNLIYFYQYICYKKANNETILKYDNELFELPNDINLFDDILNRDPNINKIQKNFLFQIFLDSNNYEIRNNQYCQTIFKNNYKTICHWFDIDCEKDNFSFDNIYKNHIEISRNNTQELLKINILLLDAYINQKEQFYFIMASFFYAITNELKDTKDYSFHEKFKFNFLFDNVFNNFQKFSQKISFNIKSMIAFLDYYQIKENCKFRKLNDLYKFEDIEKIIFKDSKTKINRLSIERFKNLSENIKSQYNTNNTILEILKKKLSNIFFKKIDTTKNIIELIPYSRNFYSTEISILISGFGSELDNHQKEWREIISSYRRSMFYFYQWPSDSFEKIIFSSLPTKVNLLSSLFVFDSDLPKNFKNIKHRAKVCGKFLGLILSTKKLFGNCQINLIGFSLGCHVIKYCLKELFENKNIEHNIINNVVFIAGATRIKKSKFNDIFNDVIRGRIINIYSNQDFILKYLYTCSIEKVAIGSQELKFENVDNKVDDNNCKVENFNMNQFGHLDYRDNLEEVLKIINL
jgi:hypothetical protein